MSSMSVRDLLASSLRLAGILADGETPSASEAVDALLALNQLLEGWNIESLAVYCVNRTEHALTSGKADYTCGTGGDFATIERPTKIENAAVLIGDIEYPVVPCTDAEWAEIPDKALSSSLPEALHYLPTYPLGTVQLWPAPGSGMSLVLYAWNQLTAVADVNATLSLPPGYLKALRYNLAVELAGEFGAPLSQVVAEIAMGSRAAIKRQNKQLPLRKCDPAVLAPSRFYSRSAFLAGR